MNLAIFDLDNTLLNGDSDYQWGQFLIGHHIVDGEEYERENDRYYEQYKAGTLDIHAFLRFALAPLAAHPRDTLAQWHAEFMHDVILPKITPQAKALVDQGADIMMQHTDSPAPLQVAENRGIWGVGQASDMRKFAPNAQITAIVDNWNGYYIDQARAVLDGSWKSTDTWGGFAAGMTQMAPYGARVPADVVALGKKVEEAIRSGKLHPFAGPAKDRGGKLRIPSGSHASDGELLGMDWFVEGVQGSLPS